ncbi:MAG TPA: R3H domain-containing nucleic acid-binding protein [Nitriliruptorales bacterium]
MAARGPLEDALRSALADALKTTPDNVSLTVEADGWADVRDQEAKVKITMNSNDAAAAETGAADLDDAVSETPKPSEDEMSDEASTGSDDGHDANDRDDVGADDVGADDVGADDVGADDEGPTPEELDEEADAAADFMETLLDAFDLPGDLRIRVSTEHAEVEVVDVDGGALIGRRGQTLDAIQELVRCSLQRQFQRRTRVRIDVEGYRARRLEKLEEKTAEAIDEVLDTGKAVRMEPMDVFERKAVHGLVAKHEGVDSHSQGREPGRRVIIEPV